MNTSAFIRKFKIALWLITALLCLTTLTAFSQKPELYVSTGHTDFVDTIAFSPDGKTLASGGFDNTIKFWDAATGRELKTFKGHLGDVYRVAFSHDGKTLAAVSSDQTIKLWDMASVQELKALVHSVKGPLDRIASLAFSPDGRTLAGGSQDNTIKLWDVATGQGLKTLMGHSNNIYSVAFSPDCRTLASGSGDDTIKLWDVASGRELKTLKGHSGSVIEIAFNPAGKMLASVSLDNTIKLWDVASGRELKTLKGYSQGVHSVAFSPNGKTLAGGGNDGTIKLWDVALGQELKTLNGHSSIVESVAFSPDGKTLASGSLDRTIKLWDVTMGQELKTLKGHSSSVISFAFSPEGNTLAGGSNNAIKLWSAASGQELKTLRVQSSIVWSIAFSPDGKTLVSGNEDTIKLWDVATGQELKTLKGVVNSVAFSPDGKTLASESGDTIKLWNVATGRELKTLKGIVNSIAFSPDGKRLASGSVDHTIKLWNVASGRELKTLKGHLEYSEQAIVAFSPDGKTLASGSGGTIKLWNVASGQELKTLKGHASRIMSVAFSPNGKTLASGSLDSTSKLWDVASGRELKTLKGHSTNVRSVAFSPDGKTLASGSLDSTIKLWDVSSGNELASLIALDETDWIVITPDGLFDGSPSAWNKIIWRFSTNLYDFVPVEAYFSDFYYPGLLSDVFARKNPKAPSDISQKDRRQPVLKLTLADTQSNATLTARNLRIKINVSQAPAGAQDVRLFRNGSLVKVWHRDVLKGQTSVTLDTMIPIVAGANNLTAYAFNRDNVKSSDATLVVTGAESLKRKGTAYILAVGVNEYSNTQYNLAYAVADAKDFSGEFKRQQEKLANYARVEVMALNDKDATKANILKFLADMAAKIQPEDGLTIYFAGHGTAQQNRFYLIPHDLGYTGSRTKLDTAGLQSILAHSISDEELEQAVEGIDAGQMLLVIDACNSGQALEAEEKRRGPMNSKGLAQLAYEKGMYILTAAQSYQAAKEAAKLGHGFLTYALVEEGLKTTAADREPKDGQVLLREWLNFATERVPQMQQDEIKTRRLEREKSKTANPSDGGNVQRPRVFYRRETEPYPLVVARP